jgi:hypothetical protein
MLHAVIGVNCFLVDPTQRRRQPAGRFSLSIDAARARASASNAEEIRKLSLYESNYLAELSQKEPNPKLDRSESRSHPSHQGLTDEDDHRGDNQKRAQ